MSFIVPEDLERYAEEHTTPIPSCSSDWRRRPRRR
jgi:hypothetical protein